MASKHRKRSRSANRAATVGVAAATVTALIIGSAPPQRANSATPPGRGVEAPPVELSAAAAGLVSALAATTGTPGLPPMQLAPGAPDPASIPDLSFGLGTRGYDLVQTLAAALESGILDNVNLSGLLQYLGYDPTSAINTALGNLLTQALSGVPVDLSGVPVLGSILTGAGITNVAAVLNLLGFNLADPLNLAGVPTPGINVITAGGPFTLLKFLGVDLGWVPGLPNSVAEEINGTPYLEVGALGVLSTLLAAYPVPPLKNTVANATLQGLIATVKLLPGGDLNAIDVRVPLVAGFGLGAFAAGMAYPQVVEQLAGQPGGADFTGTSPLAGSLTILPLVLLRNPGRANGGVFARFYPEAALLGIDTVTPDTEVSSSTNPDNQLDAPVGTTGIVAGGANLVPIKLDGTVEYDPLSDFPAWPNPISLANSVAALFFPTYLLRGITAASLTEVVDGQLNPQLDAALANTSGPLALNLYLTVPVNDALPLLEPIRLPIDVINLFTGANLNNPIATALEPVLTSLVNLGYTDVQRNVVNGVPEYDRTLDQANVITPFGSLPQNINWGQVPGDLFQQLAAGVQKAIADGLVSDTPVVNPLATLAQLLGIDGLPGEGSATAQLSAPKALVANTTGSRATHADTATTSIKPGAPAQADNSVKAATARTEAVAKRAQDSVDATQKKATDGLDTTATDGQKQIQNVAKSAQRNVQKTGKAVTGAGKAGKSAAKDSTSDGE
ncbi:PE-PPE domain-containing protein [Mycolicibacterium komossense]|uniref:PE-PPE domain-containing protein n=1 Tax=Mycolicibacterium komossense TaxID=1779 RepID=A0ABT3C8E0_9MYCO|nr:PE-PPE domain-containing protein [Mycolicibacterium komossense]MCV7225724.1 PE-PPE domain-containing protein [Mycolicibacterium komossense]